MNFHIVQPTSALRPYIKQYCFMEASAEEGMVQERVIPTENIQLMFHYQDPFVVLHPNDVTSKQPRSIISGLSDTFSDVSTHGNTGVVFVSFQPTGACHFFNFPLSEIENRSIDLSDIFRTEVAEVEERLFLTSGLTEKVTIIEDFLRKRFSPIPIHDDLLIRQGYELVKQSKGQTTATDLSNSLSITNKTLERKFSQYLGKTTKQVIKLIRFQAILQSFSDRSCQNLTECAFQNGYYDQSHFIKDFKTYSGYTPKEFVEKYPDFHLG